MVRPQAVDRCSISLIFALIQVVACAPALKILPRIIENNLALSSFSRAFESEVTGYEAVQVRLILFSVLQCAYVDV